MYLMCTVDITVFAKLFFKYSYDLSLLVPKALPCLEDVAVRWLVIWKNNCISRDCSSRNSAH